MTGNAMMTHVNINRINPSTLKITDMRFADSPPPWNPTKEWDKEWANDRRWS